MYNKNYDNYKIDLFMIMYILKIHMVLNSLNRLGVHSYKKQRGREQI